MTEIETKKIIDRINNDLSLPDELDRWAEVLDIPSGQFVNQTCAYAARHIREAQSLIKELTAVLAELVRLYDWRNELAAQMKADPSLDQKSGLLKYGREKKAAWVASRPVLYRAEEFIKKAGG